MLTGPVSRVTVETMGTVQVSARVREDIAPRLDVIAERLCALLPGGQIQRSDALRAVIEKGVEVMEASLGIAPAPTPQKKAGKR